MDTHSWSGKSFVDNYLLWEINIVGTNELLMLQIEKLEQIIVICSFWGDWYLFVRFIYLVTAHSFTFRPNQITKYSTAKLPKELLTVIIHYSFFHATEKTNLFYRKFSTFYHFENICCRLFWDGESADITETNGFWSFFEN